jgi:tubulin---tyrosine ligase
MRAYYQNLKLNVFNYLPLTFHLKGPNDLEAWNQLQEAFQKRAEEEQQSDKKSRNIWIVKPGENSNRGNGIRVCSTMLEIKEILRSGGSHKNGMPKTYIVQQYLDRPLLY